MPLKGNSSEPLFYVTLFFIEKLRAFVILSDEGLTLETSALKLFTVANSCYQLSWWITFSCHTLPPRQHHIFFRNLIPLFNRKTDVTRNVNRPFPVRNDSAFKYSLQRTQLQITTKVFHFDPLSRRRHTTVSQNYWRITSFTNLVRLALFSASGSWLLKNIYSVHKVRWPPEKNIGLRTTIVSQSRAFLRRSIQEPFSPTEFPIKPLSTSTLNDL